MLLGLVSSALIIMVNAASSSEIKKELSGLRNQQAELKKEREALQAKIKERQSKTQALVDKKSDIDQQIRMTQASINNLNEQVQQYSLLIANKQAELEASQAEEQRLNEQYKTRIRSMEETGNISVAHNGKINVGLSSTELKAELMRLSAPEEPHAKAATAS